MRAVVRNVAITLLIICGVLALSACSTAPGGPHPAALGDYGYVKERIARLARQGDEEA